MPELGRVKPRTRAQRSVYFDTADQNLRGAGLSLRIRYADGKRLQTMKAESAATAGLFVRQEWERQIDSDFPQLDGEADAPAQLLGGKPIGPLQPTFTADVTRTIWDVRHEGARIELVLDEGEVAVDGRVERVSEVELELAEGAPAALFTFAHALALRVPVRLGVLTKSERGQRLLDARHDRAAKAEPVPLTRDMTAAQAFQAIARACLRHYRLNETLLLSTRGAQPLHQARVALRRLRSALSLFRPLLRDDRYERMRVGLRALAAQLGTARNLDVLIGRVGDAPLAATLREARERAYDAVCTALSEPEARLLLLELTEWIAIGAWRTDEETAGDRPAEREELRLRPARPLAPAAEARRQAAHQDRRRGPPRGAHPRQAAALRRRVLQRALHVQAAAAPAQGVPVRARTAAVAARRLERRGDGAGGAPRVRLRRAPPPNCSAAPSTARALLHEAAEGYDELMDLKRFWAVIDGASRSPEVTRAQGCVGLDQHQTGTCCCAAWSPADFALAAALRHPGAARTRKRRWPGRASRST
jgi:inorganic triphosphatase YgiF